MNRPIKIALAGNPNAGKTTLFNAITGARQHVGNWPGVTVEKKEGAIQFRGEALNIVDLPGTYSLTAYSTEELIARDFLIIEKPDVVVDIVDASNLDRNLYLTMQFRELGIPLVVCLNMVDVAEKRGISINAEELSKLLKAPVVPTVARAGKGVKAVLETAVNVAHRALPWEPQKIPYSRDVDEAIEDIERIILDNRFYTDTYPVHWLAVKLAEGDDQIRKLIENDSNAGAAIIRRCDKLAKHVQSTFDTEPEAIVADYRYGHIMGITRQAAKSSVEFRIHMSDKVDKVLTNRVLGPAILLAILYGIYEFVFQGSETPVGWLEGFFGWLKDVVSAALPEGLLHSLIVSGIIDGVGGVLGFMPLILFMFFCIAILEDSGYMARVAYMLDRVLSWFGLHGNSVMALIVGGGILGGCAVPGVMASRTLRDPRERLATLLVTPLMNCGAKIPVYALLIAAFFSEDRARMMFILTLISWLMALFGAKLLRSTVLRGPKTPFVMELPPYRMPTISGLLIHTWERTWEYVKKAGTTILAISILMWALMTFPELPAEKVKEFEQMRDQARIELLSRPGAKAVIPDQKALSEFSDYYASFREAGAKGRKAESLRSSPFYGLARSLEALNSEDLAKAGSLYIVARGYEAYKHRLNEINGEQARTALRGTIAGRMGHALESVTGVLGFDWRVNTALVGGFAAKEVIVSTMGTAFSLGEVDTDEPVILSEQLRNEPGWNPLTAFTLMIFTMIYAPCFVTLVCIRREAGSVKWALFAMIYTTVGAFIIAFLVHQSGLLLGLGV